ncbi:MAG TPA: hypothetical protein VG711_08500 [Phycisphaerales bacterium]|nr:hypothetical protein [Phycisphaerales bacterium]
MLTDPKAVEIISRARQKNVAQPARGEQDIKNLLADFFTPAHFTSKNILELGPGQYDFARSARDLGAIVEAIDSDPAVIELGNYLGFSVTQANLKHWNPTDSAAHYDGLFCKFSINALWLDSPEEVASQIRTLDSLLKPAGWGWIAPWNGGKIINEQPAKIQPLLDAQIAAFKSAGWLTFNLTKDLTLRYGINGSVANNTLFIKNISIPSVLSSASRI